MILQFSLREERNCIGFVIKYNTDVYKRPMIEGLMVHYKNLIQSLLAFPKLKIGFLEYLTVKQKEQQLYTFNASKVDYPKNETVIKLFEEQVRRTPDNTAVVFENNKLTFKELNEQSDELAEYLRATHKVQFEDFVGIKLERSEWMIVAMLAILKVGGAYVPIDPVYPQDRIDYLLEDSNCKVLIDEEEIKSFIKVKGSLKTEYTEIRNIIKDLKWNNLAYVIYTSGSTGRPKGVMIGKPRTD